MRDAVGRDDTHYSLGSVLNHVLLHQTVIGLEAKEQLALAGEERPDIIIGSCGGGSNLGGIALPFVPDAGVDLLAVEPSSCPTLTEGRFEYDFGDTAGMTPLLAMYTLGHDFVPPSIHAGGLRYHGDAPDHLQPGQERPHAGRRLPPGQGVRRRGAVRPDRGHHPRPGDGARHPGRDRRGPGGTRGGQEKVILFSYSGHGLLDLGAYDDYLHGRLIEA